MSAAENIRRDEAQERASFITVEDYDVVLDLSRQEEGATTFGSRTTIRFGAEGDAVALAAGTWVDFIAQTLHRVTLNGEDLTPDDLYDGARLQLPHLQEQNTLTVEGDALYSSTGEGLHRFTDPVDGEVYLYSQFEVPDSRRVFAVFEQPDLKAPFRFSVTAPEHWRVISNSPTPAPAPAGEGLSRWDFSPTPVLSSYVTAIIAGPYRGTESTLTNSEGRQIPLGVYARASLAEHLDAEDILKVTREGFAFYEKQFGVPYPFEKYDQIFVPDFNAGAMENAGAVTFLENYVFRSAVPQAMVHARAITILHELAHMWFGDLVTMRWWNDLWLNESFAEFTSTLAAAEGTEDFTAAWNVFAALEKNWAYKQDQLSSTHPVMAEIRDLDDVAVNFDGITYAKGASVLRQLVAWVGQENFMAGVRSYFEEFAWSNTELPDLMRHLTAASGRDLETWTQAWLQSSGVNTLVTEVETDDAGLITSLRLRQLPDDADGLLRPHRVGVGIYGAGEDGRLVRTGYAELDVDGEVTEVAELVGSHRGELILPNDGDLGYCRIRLDEGSAAAAAARLSEIADSLPRTLLWTSFWEAVRDGVMPASEFVELLIRHLHAEIDSSVIRTLLRQSETAVGLYVHPEKTQQVRRRLSAALKELLETAEPESDRQLQYLKALMVHAEGEQVQFLQNLASGEAVIAGRTLSGAEADTDLRWELLTALASHGVDGAEELIAEAAEQDATANGHLARVEALAARPSAQVKEEVWEAAVVGLTRSDSEQPDADSAQPHTNSEKPYTNSEQRRAVAGFKRVRDKELLAQYAPAFFEQVPTVWAEASKELAMTVVTALFPTWAASEETLKLAETTISEVQEEHPSLARMLGEGRDELQRALRAQQRDA